MHIKEIIKKYTLQDYSEPPEEMLTWLKGSFSELFDGIGYDRADIPEFDCIIEFMARYKIATFNHESVSIAYKGTPFGELFDHTINGKQFRLPKGLLLYGSYGTGKTLAARVIADKFQLPFMDTYRISLEYLTKNGNDWLADWLFSHSKTVVIVDDIGSEGDVRKFGNESPLGAILSTRARFWEMYGTPTIYTTNFATPKALAENYGNNERLLDRLVSYHVGVEFAGASRRK